MTIKLILFHGIFLPYTIITIDLNPESLALNMLIIANTRRGVYSKPKRIIFTC